MLKLNKTPECEHCAQPLGECWHTIKFEGKKKADKVCCQCYHRHYDTDDFFNLPPTVAEMLVAMYF